MKDQQGQEARIWPDVYAECEVCGNPRIRGEACGDCELDAQVEGFGSPTGPEPLRMTIENLTDEPVHYRVVVVGDESPLDGLERALAEEQAGRKPTDPPPPHEPRSAPGDEP